MLPPATTRRCAALLAICLGAAGALGANLGAAGAVRGPDAVGGRGSSGVGVATCTFVDRSRTTTDYANHPPKALPGRVLRTELRYPTHQAVPGEAESPGAPPAARAGGYPTVVFAHGFAASPDTYRALLDAWVRLGFVVVAPIFPDDNGTTVAAEGGAGSGIEDDLVNEPADLAFVARRVLAASAGGPAGCPIARHLVDRSALALAGQSDGAQAAGMLAFDDGTVAQTGQSDASLRSGLVFRAAVLMSGAPAPGDPYQAAPGSPALLVVQSATDQCNPPQESVDLYDAVHQPDKWFLELLDAPHLPPYDGADPAAFAVVARVTGRFLRLELDGSQPGAGFVHGYGDASPAVARMLTEPLAPPLSLSFDPESCDVT